MQRCQYMFCHCALVTILMKRAHWFFAIYYEKLSLVNGKWLPDFIERLKASAWHQLYLPLLPFTHARSESINADSLKLQLLTARKKE